MTFYLSLIYKPVNQCSILKKTTKTSLSDIAQQLKLSVSISKVSRYLETSNFKYRILPANFTMIYSIKQKCNESARSYIMDHLIWNKVIFQMKKGLLY